MLLIVIGINTPTAIPTNVPLNPYNPLFVFSRLQPDKYAVNVLIILPKRANTASSHEFNKFAENRTLLAPRIRKE